MLLKRAASHAKMHIDSLWESAVIQEINATTQKIVWHREHKFKQTFPSLHPVLCDNLLRCIPKFSYDCDVFFLCCGKFGRWEFLNFKGWFGIFKYCYNLF